MRQQVETERRAGTRWVQRIAGVGIVAALCLVGAPGIASARPVNPSDSQISAAQQAKAAAAQQVGAISAQLAAAQSRLDAAHAASAIALDTFEGKQADYEAAQTAAEAATAAADKAEAALSASRDQLAAFARSSYMQGSTSPGMAALMSADGPAQMLERAALLDAAGDHKVNVVDQMTAAQQAATAANDAAQSALAQAATLKQQAADALATAEGLERSARQQAAAFQAQQTEMQNQLQQAQQTLLGLEGARAAAEQYAQQQAAAAAAAERAQNRAIASAGSAGRSESNTAGRGSASAAQAAINAAMDYIGTRYAWGGGSLHGPSEGWGIDEGVVGFDCSGLTRYAYAQAGISIPRNSTRQFAAFPTVSRANLQAGDLVFWATNPDNPATIHHVALYLGGGRMIEAPQSGMTVRVTSMRFNGEYIGAVRPSA